MSKVSRIAVYRRTTTESRPASRYSRRGKKHGDITALLGKCGLVEMDGDFAYLTKMPMDSVSAENVEALTREMKGLKTREGQLQATTAATFWLGELEALSAALK